MLRLAILVSQGELEVIPLWPKASTFPREKAKLLARDKSVCRPALMMLPQRFTLHDTANGDIATSRAPRRD